MKIRHWTTREVAILKSESPAVAARLIGRSDNAIWQYRLKHGMTRRAKQCSPDEIANIAKLRDAGKTYQQIADEIGRDRYYVRRKYLMMQSGD